MTKTGSFRGRMVLGALVTVLFGIHAVYSGENQTSASATGTHSRAESSMNAVEEGALPAETDADSAFAELVRLVQAGVDPGIVLSYVENSLRFFELDADRIIYLTDLGVLSDIINAAMERDKQLLQEGIASAPAESAEQSEVMTNSVPEVTQEYLYDMLAPYGSWFYIEGYGRCWRPTVITYHTGWRPYCDNGRWVYTDCGWYWMSGYRWGWAAFHYGRWFRHARYGWCWWPDTVWAPSWVSWRYDRTYCGWAPLPPYTSCRPGTGILYRGKRVSVGFDFGLDSDCYTFIATKDFCDPTPGRHYVKGRDAKKIYDRTRVFNRMDYDARKKSMVNGGVSPNIISTLSRQAITPVSVRHEGSRAGNNGPHEKLNRNSRTLVVSRPQHPAAQPRSSYAQTHSNTQRTHPSQQRTTYGATVDRNRYSPGNSTAHRPAPGAQNTKPSGTRAQPPASQARQQHPATPSVGSTPHQPAVQRPAAPPPSSKGVGAQGNRSNGNAHGRGQANRPVNPGRSTGANGGP